MIQKLSLIIFGSFYIFAGVNHFINPDFYFPLIPKYLPFHNFINISSGILEIIFGIGVFFSSTRKLAANSVIILLLLFIPAHIYFIQLGGCVSEGLCVPAWVAWIRLFVIHPLLIYWAYKVSKI